MNINLNDNFGNIKETYLFSEIGEGSENSLPSIPISRS